jgi:hypothetical protein
MLRQLEKQLLPEHERKTLRQLIKGERQNTALTQVELCFGLPAILFDPSFKAISS